MKTAAGGGAGGHGQALVAVGAEDGDGELGQELAKVRRAASSARQDVAA